MGGGLEILSIPFLFAAIIGQEVRLRRNLTMDGQCAVCVVNHNLLRDT